MAPFEVQQAEAGSRAFELAKANSEFRCSVDDSFDGLLGSDTDVLKESFQNLSERGSELLDQVAGHSSDDSIDSPTVDACHGSLRSEMNTMLDEANLLLQNIGEVTSWRALLAQQRADCYLETIQTALANPTREKVDRQLHTVANAIATQLSFDDGDEKKAEQVPPVTISSWRTPSLAFDVVVGEEVRRSFPRVIVRARAIAEVLAKDMGEGASLPHYHACLVTVESARYEKLAEAINGNTGEASLKIRISPVGRKVFGKKSGAVWGCHNGVCAPSFRETRAVQVNAFPPRPKANVDIFTSVLHGSSDTTVSMRFKTSKTLKEDEIPEIAIDLVMASSPV